MTAVQNPRFPRIATPEIRELSAMLQAPVVSYQNGRGIVDAQAAVAYPRG